MTRNPYNAIHGQLDTDLDAAYYRAALTYIDLVRAQLSRFNLRRHRVVVYHNGLAVGEPKRGRNDGSYDRLYWEIRNTGDHPIITAIYEAGLALEELPAQVQRRLEGAVIFQGEQK